ncbi:MAG TPA: aldehyde dehydrogenase [Sphingobacteriaceae bacterium]|nr:aldehyde dehydrogenase [Sphingobacteriaceae bacterium]
METREITTTVLNDLIQINNDRIVGYQCAIEELKDKDSDLKSFFTAMIDESKQNKAELAAEVTVLGEEVDTDTTNSGKIYRVWMDIKATFTGHDRKSILASCEFGEDAAQKAYKMALEEESLPFNMNTLIFNQRLSLKICHDKIKALRDSQA